MILTVGCQNKNGTVSFQTKTWMVMKLTIVLLLFFTFQVSAKSNAQRITIVKNNIHLSEVFKDIEQQTGFHFFYDKDMIRKTAPVDVALKDAKLEQALLVCLKGQQLTYTIVKNTIVISSDKKATYSQDQATLTPIEATEPPPIEIHGKIRDENGNPLAGASVTIKGTNQGVTTNNAGDFTISVPNAQTVLIISFTNYQSQQIQIGRRTIINVNLVRTDNSLQEVVVTALGIKRQPRSLTYSTESVSTKEITEARSPNIMNSLQGKVAGLSINTSGSGVGAPDRVILRGDRSISGSSQPLYVIDGVPILGSPENINPDNIASINVLKGPNAAALYGSEAQNGVIIIETKKGAPGKTKISLSSNDQVLSPDIPIQFQNEYGQGQAGNYVSMSESSWGPKMTGQMVPTWSHRPEDQGTQIPLSPQPNNVRDFFNNGFSSANNLIISTGSDKVQANFSYTRTDVKGNVPRNSLTRNDIQTRITSKLTDKLSSDTKIGFMQETTDNPVPEDIQAYNPINKIYLIPRSIRTADAMNYSFVDANGVIRQNYWYPPSNQGINPYFEVNRITDVRPRLRGIFMTSFSYDFSKAFKLMIRGSYDFINAEEENKTSWDFFSAAPQGRYFKTKSSSSLLNGDFLFTYNKEISKDLNFNVNLGGNSRRTDNNSLSASVNNGRLGLTIPDFWSINNSAIQTVSYNPGPNSTVNSLYAFANFGWKDAIYLDLTGRNDWSSTLPASSRSYFYPSAGLSVILSDLIPNFPKQISYLKLRGSYAKVGNSAAPYSLTRFASFGPGGNNGFITLSSTLPNKQLKPEETKSYELGADIRFFDNRLALNITAYKTNTLNQLFALSLPPGSGASSLYTNGGDVQNKGIEILLSGTEVKSNNFTWATDINFSLNRNVVVKVNDQRPKLIVGTDQSFRDYVVKQGEPFGQVYGVGFKRDGKGNVVVGPDGFPESNRVRDVVLANANPDWMGGINNTFSYKNFALSFLIDHRQGGNLINVTNANLAFYGVSKATLPGREGGGLIFGKDVFSNYSAVTDDGKPNDIKINPETFWTSIGGIGSPIGEAFTESMTNTRLRELILGYTLPSSLFKKSMISKVQISLVGRNLLYISRAAKDLDADIYVGTSKIGEGQSIFAPPTTRSYGINIKIDFE